MATLHCTHCGTESDLLQNWGYCTACNTALPAAKRPSLARNQPSTTLKEPSSLPSSAESFIRKCCRSLMWCGILLLLLLVGGNRPSILDPPSAARKEVANTATGPLAVRSITAAASLELDGSTYSIRGPYSHDNMSVFFLSSERQDERTFLTLDEGLKSGIVKIAEQDHESVSALQIDNQSDRPLYLQEGERLQGGKQDRTIIASLVVPPRSGKMSLPTMCVEANRWREGEKGKQFGFTVNAALAPKGVRGAAKVEGSQGDVWNCVDVQKNTAANKFKSKNTNSSVNEMLDDPQVLAISEEYGKALGSGAPDGPDSCNILGVAIVINGQIEEVNTIQTMRSSANCTHA
jgi:hypothetical protein